MCIANIYIYIYIFQTFFNMMFSVYITESYKEIEKLQKCRSFLALE